MNQISITGTNSLITLDRLTKTFAVESPLEWTFDTQFIPDDLELSLDEEGDLFEKSYVLSLEATPKKAVALPNSIKAKSFTKDIQEIAKIFAFIEDNKKNIFELLGVRGVLE